MMVLVNIVCFIAILFGTLVAVLDLCFAISEYSQYKKRTLNRTYQRLNAKVFISTYHLFPRRYKYFREKDSRLDWLTYTVVKPGGNPYFPNTTEYYILFNFIDYCRVNAFLTREESAKEYKQIVDRETNAVLEDLHKLTKEEIEKADREVDSAIANVKKHTVVDKD